MKLKPGMALVLWAALTCQACGDETTVTESISGDEAPSLDVELASRANAWLREMGCHTSHRIRAMRHRDIDLRHASRRPRCVDIWVS